MHPSPLIYRLSRIATRSLMAATRQLAGSSAAKDWDAVQYLKFEDERTRASRDLLQRVPLSSPTQIVDLGCGPGNSTKILVDRFPQAHITGIDSSPDMIAKAKVALPEIDFAVEDLENYHPAQPTDLFFCNAVLQWLPETKRLRTVTKLLSLQPPGGVFAFQVPDNLSEPSHEAMREVAAQEPWATTFSGSPPARDLIESAQQIYDELGPHCSTIDIWHTCYQHVMHSHESIVEWLKSTGLRPYIDALPDAERVGYLAEYLARLRNHYPVSFDGKVLFRFPRLFVVAVRK